METQQIKINQIDQNKGQIAGLPANPRQWTRDDVERLAKSIEETPELLEARPLIAVPHDGKYIVLGGNLRLAALKRLGRKEAPVYVLPEDTPIDKLREIVVKDNGAFGSWDFDMLANEWDDLPLLDWGVPSWTAKEEVSPDDYGTDFNLPDGEGPQSNQITFYFSPEQKDYVLEMLERVQNVPEEVMGNKNINGNRLYTIVEQWEKSRT